VSRPPSIAALTSGHVSLSRSEYFLFDPFGSVAMLTGSTGSQTAPASGTYQYDPYGSSLGSGPATFGYNASQRLPAGLVHFGSRYYQPVLGQWTQQDPLNQAEGLAESNAFAYADDDPTNESDMGGELGGCPSLSAPCAKDKVLVSAHVLERSSRCRSGAEYHARCVVNRSGGPSASECATERQVVFSGGFTGHISKAAGVVDLFAASLVAQRCGI
jgi:RHS repeat-associated protein